MSIIIIRFNNHIIIIIIIIIIILITIVIPTPYGPFFFVSTPRKHASL